VVRQCDRCEVEVERSRERQRLGADRLGLDVDPIRRQLGVDARVAGLAAAGLALLLGMAQLRACARERRAAVERTAHEPIERGRAKERPPLGRDVAAPGEALGIAAVDGGRRRGPFGERRRRVARRRRHFGRAQRLGGAAGERDRDDGGDALHQSSVLR